jgi:tetratricopeptide (TPR) repeat protein
LLEENLAELTPYERGVVEARRAQLEGDRQAWVGGFEAACERAPGSKACYNFAICLTWYANDPRRSVEVFSSLEPEKGWMRGWTPYWTQFPDAAHAAGMHDLELNVVRAGRQYYPDNSILLTHEVFARIGLGRVDEAFTFLEDSVLVLLPDAENGGFLRQVGNALEIHRFEEDAIRAWELSVAWYEGHLDEDSESRSLHHGIAWPLYQLGRLDEAEDHWKKAASLNPANITSSAALGMVAATKGDRTEGRRVMDWLDAQEGVPIRTILQWKALIAAALGEKDEAVGYLEDLWAGPNVVPLRLAYRMYPFRSLHGYPAYENLYWPEGR